MKLLVAMSAIALCVAAAPACDKKKEEAKTEQKAAEPKKDEAKKDEVKVEEPKADEAKADEKKEEPTADEAAPAGDEKKDEAAPAGDEAAAPAGDEKKDEAAPAADTASWPEACKKAQACVQAIAKSFPAAQAAADASWKGLSAMLSNPATAGQADTACTQMFNGFKAMEAMPNFPAECKGE